MINQWLYSNNYLKQRRGHSSLHRFQTMESVSIITTVVSSNITHCEVYSIQHYVIKFVSDLRPVTCFPRVLNKIDRHEMLPVALNTITLTFEQCYYSYRGCIVCIKKNKIIDLE